MIPIALPLLLSVLTWGISLTGGFWLLLTLRDIRDELRALRKLLQDERRRLG
ncbi:MAG TPA: hypothetical protein VK191_10360 [Symbiobacteriaceae bacterium]|nr:hypothetical protein [Symbiobacteriaceae bacterium]